VNTKQCQLILSTYSRFSSSNRGACFKLLDMMLAAVSYKIDVYTTVEEKNNK